MCVIQNEAQPHPYRVKERAKKLRKKIAKKHGKSRDGPEL